MVRMNPKLNVEEDSQGNMFINQEDYKNRMVSPRIEWYLKGRNPTNMEGY
jgi:hypothetical protein